MRKIYIFPEAEGQVAMDGILVQRTQRMTILKGIKFFQGRWIVARS